MAVGRVIPKAVNPVQVRVLETPASLYRTMSFCPSVGVPVRVKVVLFATAESSYTSVTSISITAVASSVVVTTLWVIRLFVKVFVELIVGMATLPIVAQVVKSGDILLTIPPVPVEVAPQRVFTISATVVSSRTEAEAVVIVVLAGRERVFISASTSESIKAQAAVTLAVSVTSAPSSTFIIVLTSLAVNASISLHPHAIRHTIVLFGICTIVGEPVPDCCTSIECAGV